MGAAEDRVCELARERTHHLLQGLDVCGRGWQRTGQCTGGGWASTHRIRASVDGMLIRYGGQTYRSENPYYRIRTSDLSVTTLQPNTLPTELSRGADLCISFFAARVHRTRACSGAPPAVAV